MVKFIEEVMKGEFRSMVMNSKNNKEKKDDGPLSKLKYLKKCISIVNNRLH